MLSSHLHLGIPSGIFPSGFTTKIVYVFRIRATCSALLIHLDLLW
jgi:hypothetical protein